MSAPLHVLWGSSERTFVDTAHPKNTIDPIILQKWGKKLKDRYGLSEEMLPDLQSSARTSMDLPRRSFEREEETPQ